MHRRGFLKHIGILVTSLWIWPRLLLERLSDVLYPQCIYVSSDGSDWNDGLSPKTAKHTLSAALQAIEPTSYTQSAVVASGYFHDEMVLMEDNVVIFLEDNIVLEDVVIEAAV